MNLLQSKCFITRYSNTLRAFKVQAKDGQGVNIERTFSTKEQKIVFLDKKNTFLVKKVATSSGNIFVRYWGPPPPVQKKSAK